MMVANAAHGLLTDILKKAGSLERHVPNTPAALADWLKARSELEKRLRDIHNGLMLPARRFGNDDKAQSAWREWLKSGVPLVREMRYNLDCCQFDAISELGDERFLAYGQKAQAAALTSNPKNRELFGELDALSERRRQLSNAIAVEIDGDKVPRAQLAGLLRADERDVRKKAWLAVNDAWAETMEDFSDIITQMIALRGEVADNAGFGNFCDWSFVHLQRWEYGQNECYRYHEAVARHITPLLRAYDQKLADAIGVEQLAPWDVEYAEQLSMPRLRQISSARLLREMGQILSALDDELGGQFEHLKAQMCFDIEAREDKARGGFQVTRHNPPLPFVFINGNGTYADLRSLIHESGHALHSVYACRHDLIWDQLMPMELAETASMALEYLSTAFWHIAYDNRQSLASALTNQWARVPKLLSWIAAIDRLQHEMYSTMENSEQRRRQRWLELDDWLGRSLDWQEFEHHRQWQWHRQLHLYTSPFYYFEYACGLTVAVELEAMMAEQGTAQVMQKYRSFLAMGGSRSLKETFAALDCGLSLNGQRMAKVAARLQGKLQLS